MKRPAFLTLLAITLVAGPVLAQQHQHSHSGSSGQYRYHNHSQGRTYSYRYGGRSHTEEFADQLYHQMNNACWEAHHYYQHERNWKQTYTEMYQILKDAKHVKQLAHDDYHHRNQGDHISKDLYEMDKLLHHIQGELRHWTPHYGSRPTHRHGSGSLKQELAKVEDTLHHLMRDYGVPRRNPAPPSGSTPPGPPPAPGPPSTSVPGPPPTSSLPSISSVPVNP